MNQDDIEQALANILREEIDKELLVDLRCADLVNQGWTMARIDASIEDIGSWMQANIHGDWRAFHDRWLFENADDAVLLLLRWS